MKFSIWPGPNNSWADTLDIAKHAEATGWYHGKGDPEGTVRYWDGEKWIGDPVIPPDAPPAPSVEPSATQVAYGQPGYARAPYGQPAMPDYAPATGFSFERIFSPNGRVNRATTAGVVGIAIGIVLALTILDLVIGTYSEEAGLGVFGTLGSLAFIWPQLATASKRFHDFGFSGWTAALTMIPFVNLLVLIWLLAHPGNAGPNKYGPQPPSGFNL